METSPPAVAALPCSGRLAYAILHMDEVAPHCRNAVDAADSQGQPSRAVDFDGAPKLCSTLHIQMPALGRFGDSLQLGIGQGRSTNAGHYGHWRLARTWHPLGAGQTCIAPIMTLTDMQPFTRHQLHYEARLLAHAVPPSLVPRKTVTRLRIGISDPYGTGSCSVSENPRKRALLRQCYKRLDHDTLVGANRSIRPAARLDVPI